MNMIYNGDTLFVENVTNIKETLVKTKRLLNEYDIKNVVIEKGYFNNRHFNSLKKEFKNYNLIIK